MPRTPWFDETTQLPILDQKVQELESFTSAMADGKIEKKELERQYDRLSTAMKSVEKELSDPLHAKVTDMMVELTAYSIMRTLHELQAERLRSRFG